MKKQLKKEKIWIETYNPAKGSKQTDIRHNQSLELMALKAVI